MNPFPTLIPTNRPSVAPKYQNSGPIESINGSESRILLSNGVTGPFVNLEFTLENEADLLSVINHWRVAGIAGRFSVDTATLGSDNTGIVPTVTGHQWSYAEAPAWEETCEAYFLQVSLVFMPSDQTVYGGVFASWLDAFRPGIGPGQFYAGVLVTAYHTFSPGIGPYQSYAGVSVRWSESFTSGVFG